MVSQWLEILTPVVRQAGTNARRRFLSGKSTATRKNSGDWVTDVDHETEAFIMERLRHYFPEHGILGEESGLSGSTEECWVLDPLDGTTNFVHRNPHFAVSLAYCQGGRSKVAIIYDIMADELYTAVAGGGAYREDERLRLSNDVSYKDALFIASGQVGEGKLWEHVVTLSRETEGMRKTGSSVLDLAWLAAGQTDAVVSGPVNFWDVAAGALLVREAGGFICDVQGATEFTFGERTNSFVAASPGVFPRFFSTTKAFCQKATVSSDNT